MFSQKTPCGTPSLFLSRKIMTTRINASIPSNEDQQVHLRDCTPGAKFDTCNRFGFGRPYIFVALLFWWWWWWHHFLIIQVDSLKDNLPQLADCCLQYSRNSTGPVFLVASSWHSRVDILTRISLTCHEEIGYVGHVRQGSLRGCRACRQGCHEDAMRKLLSWNEFRLNLMASHFLIAWQSVFSSYWHARESQMTSVMMSNWGGGRGWDTGYSHCSDSSLQSVSCHPSMSFWQIAIARPGSPVEPVRRQLLWMDDNSRSALSDDVGMWQYMAKRGS